MDKVLTFQRQMAVLEQRITAFLRLTDSLGRYIDQCRINAAIEVSIIHLHFDLLIVRR